MNTTTLTLRRIQATVVLVLATALGLNAQYVPVDSLDKSDQVQRDANRATGPLDRVIDWLTIEPNEKRAAADPTIYPSKIVFAPYIIFTPETSVGFGIGGSYLFKMPNSGDEDRTRTSALPLAFTYTINNQVLFYSGFEVFWPDEKYVLSGNLRAQVFPQLFFGVGRDTPAENEVVFESTQFVVEPIFSKQVFVDKLFLGGGVRYRHVTATDFVLSDGDDVITEVPESFGEFDGAQGSTSAGIEAAALYDTRNSLLNATTGTYLEVTYGAYGEVLGGTNEYTLLRADARHFFQLRGDENFRDVLGLQAIGYFASGDVPLVELGQLGSGEIMRGYYEGRYTDNNYVAAQVEYRLNLNGPAGFVGFASAGDVRNEISDFSLSDLRTAYGVGIRYLVDPVERLNIRADFALTGEQDFNFYIQIAEAF